MNYGKTRWKRQQKIIQMGFQNGKIYHIGFPASIIRNTAMKKIPKERLQRRMDWLYGWKDRELKPFKA